MANVKIKPIGDRVLVEHIEEKEQVRGGIIIPDSAKEKPQEAKVIALGTGKRGEDGKVSTFEVKVGDKVAEGSLILMLEAADTAPATAALAGVTVCGARMGVVSAG